MSSRTYPRIFKSSLIGTAVLLLTLAGPINARAAISQGPKMTNSAAAQERRETLNSFMLNSPIKRN